MASDSERSRVETQGVPTGRRRPGLLFAAIRERFLGRGPGVLCFVLARAHHALARGTVRCRAGPGRAVTGGVHWGVRSVCAGGVRARPRRGLHCRVSAGRGG